MTGIALLNPGISRPFVRCATVLTILVLPACRPRDHRLEIPDPRGDSLSALSAAYGANVVPRLDRPAAAGEPIPGWTVRLADRTRQSVRVEPDGDRYAFVLSSQRATDDILLATPPIAVEPGTKFCHETLFRKSPTFTGTVAAAICVARSLKGGERVEECLSREGGDPGDGGWLVVRQGFAVPPETDSVRVQVSGRFAGEVRVKDVSLRRLKEYPPRR